MKSKGKKGLGSSVSDLPADLKAVVFDVDGTLYHLRGLQRAVQIYFLRGHWHKPFEASRVRRAIRAYRRAAETLRLLPAQGIELAESQIEFATKSCGLPKEYIRACVHRWMAEEPLAFLPRFRYEGVQEVLSELRQRGLHLAVFSDYPAQAKLHAMELGDVFELVMSAQDPDVQMFKPDPRGLKVVLERMGVEANQAIYVGDRPAIDGVAAERAGMAWLIAGDGHRNPQKSFRELRDLLLSAKTKRSTRL
ncbi:MAG: HAD family hydrolase [Candidatus Acidiferrales bacterium]